MTYLQPKLLQVIKDGSQMYPGTLASGPVLWLIDQSVVTGEHISTAVSKEFPSLLFLSNPSQLLPHLQNHLEGHLRRSPKNPKAVTLLSTP